MKKTLLIFLILIFTAAANAQDVEYLSMEQCISKALSGNNIVRSAGYGIKKAEWDQYNAWTLLFPKVTLNSRYMWIDDSTFALRDFSRYFQDPSSPFQIPQTVFQESYFTSVNVEMTLFNGILLNGLRIASANKSAAENMDLSARQNIVFQVISNYLNVLRAKEMVDLQTKYLELSKLNYEKANRLFDAGRYSRTEALRWKVEWQQQKSNLTTAESDLRSAYTVLARLLNTQIDEQIEIVPDIPQKLMIESQKIAAKSDEEILDMIRLSNDQLVKVNASLAAYGKNTEISKMLYQNSYASYMPNVSLNYEYAWRENNTVWLDDYSPQTLMVNLSIPLFTSFQNLTSLKSNYYDYRRNKENFEDELQNTRMMLTQTANNIINFRTQMELSQTNSEFNEYNYGIVAQQREQGLVSNIDFIDAKLNLQDAKLQQVGNHYQFVTSVVELYYLLGKTEHLLD